MSDVYAKVKQSHYKTSKYHLDNALSGVTHLLEWKDEYESLNAEVHSVMLMMGFTHSLEATVKYALEDMATSEDVPMIEKTPVWVLRGKAKQIKDIREDFFNLYEDDYDA